MTATATNPVEAAARSAHAMNDIAHDTVGRRLQDLQSEVEKQMERFERGIRVTPEQLVKDAMAVLVATVEQAKAEQHAGRLETLRVTVGG